MKGEKETEQSETKRKTEADRVVEEERSAAKWIEVVTSEKNKTH